MTDPCASERDGDLVVLGGGPAGLAAAATAAEDGLRVLLLDSTPWLGGPIWRPGPGATPPGVAQRWLARAHSAGVTIWPQATAFAACPPDVLHVERGRDVCRVRWKQMILAVGAHELFLPFPGWTLPNVMGAGGLQLLVKSGWPVRGRRVVVAGTGPLLLAVAAYLVRQGAHVSDILEQASWSALAQFASRLAWLAPSKLWQAATLQTRLLRTRYRPGCWPVAAHGADRLDAVTFTDGTRRWTRDCDVLACAFGLVPQLRWPGLLHCRLTPHGVWVDDYQRTSCDRVWAAGEITGLGGVDLALVEGQIAGHAAAGNNLAAARWFGRRARLQRFAAQLDRCFQLRTELRFLPTPETVVCRCEDVTWRAIEACSDVRAAKLYTRCGMGSCQGRICQTALQFLQNWSADHVRPPAAPVRVGSLAGADQEHADAERTELP
jgi:NADPH-dependent 2,4-dienoyl-CoA reductase/sulfur reductase-like enzyme